MTRFYSPETGGFYTSTIHKDNIPADAREISDELCIYLQKGLSQGKEISVEEDDSSQPYLIEPVFSFTRAFAQKNAEIRNAFKLVTQSLTEIYTDEETATFPTQINEALAWQADNNAATPGIDHIVANRSAVDKPTLVSRIIANSATYIDIVFPAMGKKQDYEDLLYALKLQHEDSEQPDVTQADFDAILVDFS